MSRRVRPGTCQGVPGLGYVKAGLAWDDILPILDKVSEDGMESLGDAASDPEAFMGNLASLNQEVARKCLIAQLRPRVEPALLEKGLVWEDVFPILDEIDSIEAMEQVTMNPVDCMETLSTLNESVARRWQEIKNRRAPARSSSNMSAAGRTSGDLAGGSQDFDDPAPVATPATSGLPPGSSSDGAPAIGARRSGSGRIAATGSRRSDWSKSPKPDGSAQDLDDAISEVSMMTPI